MRKTRVKGGDQHAMSVRIDNETWNWLQGEQNKNRLINELLKFWRKALRTRELNRISIRNITFEIYDNPELKTDD